MPGLLLARRAGLALAAALLACALAGAARAHGGDDHDHGAAPHSTGPALPRFAASSDLFELVGVLSGRRLTLYLDHADDNRPASGARVELELGALKVDAKPHGDAVGEFEVVLAQPLPPGVIPVTATVTAAGQADLLVSELDLHEDAPTAAPPLPGWKARAPWMAAALVLLAIAGWLGRRWLSARRVRVEGLA